MKNIINNQKQTVPGIVANCGSRPANQNSKFKIQKSVPYSLTPAFHPEYFRGSKVRQLPPGPQRFQPFPTPIPSFACALPRLHIFACSSFYPFEISNLKFPIPHLILPLMILPSSLIFLPSIFLPAPFFSALCRHSWQSVQFVSFPYPCLSVFIRG